MHQKDLFGNDVQPGKMIATAIPERKSVVAHRLLIQLHGESTGNKCGKCKFFYFRSFAKKYPKCEKSGCNGATVNHDWSSRWKACGLFEAEPIEEKEIPQQAENESADDLPF